MNSVVLIGRLARDPELSYTPQNQTAVCHMTIAVDRPKRNGEDQGADFIRIVAWGKQAETCDRYLSKGRLVAINGRIQTGSYKDRDGKTVYTTDVVANNVEFLGGGQGENFASNGRNDTAPRNTTSQNTTLAQKEQFDSFQQAEIDIPF